MGSNKKEPTPSTNGRYRCMECDTEYISQHDTPIGIKWSDGHVCRPVPDTRHTVQ